MYKLTLTLLNFVLLFAANAQAAVFYAGGEIVRITDVSISANHAPWGGPATRVFDVDIVFGTFADAYGSGGLPTGWDFDSQGMATAATYGLADALVAGGAPGSAPFLGDRDELFVPYFIGDVGSATNPCSGCTASRSTYFWGTPPAWRPGTYTPIYSTSEVQAWALFTPVATVPVPAAVWLFGSGLMVLLGLARRL